MISGTLPNSTVWWISKDGKKVWIESRELEKQKFVEKGFNVVKDRIFNPKIKKQVGELAGSRLERRLHEDSWVITLDTFLNVYPDLYSEIDKKTIEEQEKKKLSRHTKSKVSKDKALEYIRKKRLKEEYKLKEDKELKDKEKEKDKELKDKEEEDKEKEKNKPFFDISYPYVEWIKEEINKNPDKELKILSENMKEKMGKEYISMHDLRLYYGLKKILPDIGINVELGKFKNKSLLILKQDKKEK